MLGIVVFTIGRQSETYIAQHIESLCPGRTAVCSLVENPTPQWLPTQPTTEMGRSKSRCLNGVRNVLSLASPGALRRLDSLRLMSWLTANRIHVLLCEYLQVAVTMAPLSRRLGIPIVAHAHGYDVTAQPNEPGWADAYHRLLADIDDVVVVSESMRKRVVSLGARPDAIHVIPCGAAMAPDSVHRTYTSKARYTCVAIGRLVEKKGPMLLLESFRRLLETGMSAELVVIGDGPFRRPMQQYLTATGLHPSVSMLGAVPPAAVREQLRTADLFLQHSITAGDGDEEGLPVAILEAMTEGVPVVSTWHAGIPDVVKDGVSGILVQPGDCDQMARESCRLLDNPELRARIARAARQMVANEFSREIALRRLRGVIGRHWSEIH